MLAHYTQTDEQKENQCKNIKNTTQDNNTTQTTSLVLIGVHYTHGLPITSKAPSLFAPLCIDIWGKWPTLTTTLTLVNNVLSLVRLQTLDMRYSISVQHFPVLYAPGERTVREVQRTPYYCTRFCA